MIVPPDGYFAAISEVLRKYDVLLICGRGGHADSAGSGSGSAPRCSACEPDLITLAKGITSAYVPLSALPGLGEGG